MLKIQNNPDLFISDICEAFQTLAVGSRIKSQDLIPEFLSAFNKKLEAYVFPENGQGFINLDEVASLFYPGVVAHPLHPAYDDFCVRRHRGNYRIYLRRGSSTSECKHLNLVVYSKEAYARDPDIQQPEIDSLSASQDAYVVVAVLASEDPTAPYPASTLVHNIAGGNNAFKPQTRDDLDSAAYCEMEDDLRMMHRWISLAKDSEVYWKTHTMASD